MNKVHGPLIKVISEDMGFEDSTFMECLQKGFPVAGHMRNSVVGMVSGPKQGDQKISMNSLWKKRSSFNEKAVTMMRENAFSDDMIKLAKEDSEKGFMTKPIVSTTKNGKNIRVSRRIPVREWKDSIEDWRTRPVDHGSESGLKEATFSKQKTKVQGLEFLVTMVLQFLDNEKDPRMWKRDLKSAFRNVPLDQKHKWCSWSAWKVGGIVMMARHLAAPFWVGVELLQLS